MLISKMVLRKRRDRSFWLYLEKLESKLRERRLTGDSATTLARVLMS